MPDFDPPPEFDEHHDSKRSTERKSLDEALTVKNERHVKGGPYREPLKPASHDHQHDEGQRIPRIDRRGDEKRAAIEPATGHEYVFP